MAGDGTTVAPPSAPSIARTPTRTCSGSSGEWEQAGECLLCEAPGSCRYSVIWAACDAAPCQHLASGFCDCYIPHATLPAARAGGPVWGDVQRRHAPVHRSSAGNSGVPSPASQPISYWLHDSIDSNGVTVLTHCAEKENETKPVWVLRLLGVASSHDIGSPSFSRQSNVVIVMADSRAG